MDQQQHPGVPGPAGRRLHIAHRRSPSEMTPLLSKFMSILFEFEYCIVKNEKAGRLENYADSTFQWNSLPYSNR